MQEPLSSLVKLTRKQQFAGCYVMQPEEGRSEAIQKLLVPLQHIDYKVNLINSIAEINLTQQYVNPLNQYLEVFYSLPIPPQSCIHSFEAKFDDIILKGQVKEREDAEKQYNEAKAEGRKVVMAQLDKDSRDIFNITIGNIPPMKKFTIQISILQQLKVSMNTFYHLLIPSTISPRYMNLIQGEKTVPQHIANKFKAQYTSQNAFTWNFDIMIKSQRKIVFYESKSHQKLLIEKQRNKNSTEIRIGLKQNCVPNTDFYFIYTTEDFHLPSSVVGQSESTSTIMLSFIPKFCNMKIIEAYQAEKDNKEYQYDINQVKGQYVFVLDRSGSMQGTRIQKAKQALIIFLKSLPEDSYFNVISFGNEYEKMFTKSVRNSSEKFNQAKNKILSMFADMGGTEIFQPLKQCLQHQIIEGYPRQVFLLTDGDVSNTKGVIKMVKQNTKFSRVYGIGVGNGASVQLIEGCGKAGKGKSVMISDQENPSNKIIELLETSLTPLITKIDLKFKEQKLKSVIPNIKSIPYILKNEPVNFYITFEKPAPSVLQFNFSYTDPTSKKMFETPLLISMDSCQKFDSIDKLAHFKILKSLEQAVDQEYKLEDHIQYAKVLDYKKQAIEYSITHQIISEYTTFLCIGRNLVDGEFQEYKSKQGKAIFIQQPLPSQYEQQPIYVKSGSPISRSVSQRRQYTNKQCAVIGNDDQLGFLESFKIEKMRKTKMLKTLDDDRIGSAQTIQNNFQESDQLQGMHQKKSQGFLSKLCSFISFSKKKQSLNQKKQYVIEKKQNVIEKKQNAFVQTSSQIQIKEKVIGSQTLKGSWEDEQVGKMVFTKKEKSFKDGLQKYGSQFFITYLVVNWMKKHCTEQQYRLIIRKGEGWLKKESNSNKINEQELKKFLD